MDIYIYIYRTQHNPKAAHMCMDDYKEEYV